MAPEGNAAYVLEFSEMVTQGDHATKKVTSVEAKFPPGRIVITQAADAMLDELKLNKLAFLQRHLNADWGELAEEDRLQNDEALKSGNDRIFSSYPLPNKEKLWIITEWDKSATTLLLPQDY